MNGANIQERHWQSTKYRPPDHPVVRAYAEPKLRFIDNCINLHGAHVLEVGCGNGVFGYYLKNRYDCKYTGTDISQFMLKKNTLGPRLISDIAFLPFPNNAFSVVFAANLLHHVADPLQALGEMKRVCKKHLVLIEPNALNPIMFAFSLIVKAERGGLRSFKHALMRLFKENGLACVSHMTTGMISQNNTPRCLLPVLRPFDVNFPFGEYHILIGNKTFSGKTGPL